MNNSGSQSVGGSSSPKPTKKIFTKVKRLVKKFWYIFVILIVVIAAFVTWKVLSASRDVAWQQATEYYAKADYAKAEEIIRDFSIPDNPDRQRIYAQSMQATGNIDKALEGYNRLYESTEDISAKVRADE